MTQTSYAILTATGSSLLAQAVANNTTLNVTQIVIGQGTTVPTGNETALYDQIAVKDIADYGISETDAATFWFTAYLKAEEGPYAISEIGLLDKSGNLIAIGHLDPAIEKPVPASGQVVDMIIGLYLKVDMASAVTVTIDESTSVTVSDMDTLPWLPVKSITLTAPPAAVENGDVYYVPAGATNAWEGMVGLLAQKTTGGWRGISPVEGHGIGLPDGSVYQYVGGSYVAKLAPLSSPTFIGSVTVPTVTDFSKELALGAKTADARYLLLSTTSLQTVKGNVTFSGTTLVPSVTDWSTKEAIPASDADGRYVKSSAADTGPRIDGAGVNTANGQPWLSSGATFYNLIYADTAAGTGSIKSAGINTDTQNDFFPWLVTRSGIFYNLATREWANNRFQLKGSYATTDALTSGLATKQAAGDYALNSRVTAYFAGSSGNTDVANIQGVNWGAGNASAYLQVTCGSVSLALPTLDNVSSAIASYAQPKGDYVTTATYQADFNSGDSRVHDAPYNKRSQHFLATANAGDYITFPQKMGSVDACTVVAQGNTDYNCKGFSPDNNGVYLHVNGGGTNVQVAVLVSGTKP